MTYEERSAYGDSPCTLDGIPARVQGYRNDFATVSTNNGRLRAEFAWETVARVMAKGGEFRF